MPVSQAQRRWAYWADAHPKESGVSHKVAKDFEGHGIKGLPERVHKGKPVKAAEGGGISGYTLARGGSVKVYGVGNTGEDVRNIQRMLAAAGFDPGAADADFGKNTQSAVRDFQAAHGLKVDGRVGKETLGALKAVTVPNPRPRPWVNGLGAAAPEEPINGPSEFSKNAFMPSSHDEKYAGNIPTGIGAIKVSKPAPNVTITTQHGEREYDPIVQHMAASNRAFDEEQSKNARLWPLEQRLRQGAMPLDDRGFNFAKGGLAPRMPKKPKGDVIDMNHATPFKSGMIKSSVPGRTDRIPLVVDKNAFVWPADIISGLGQGNSDAGAKVLGEIMALYGPSQPGNQGGLEGGGTVPIVAAGGEFVTDPAGVAAVGNGDLKKGHAILNKAVPYLRKQIASHMLTLPGPKK